MGSGRANGFYVMGWDDDDDPVLWQICLANKSRYGMGDFCVII